MNQNLYDTFKEITKIIINHGRRKANKFYIGGVTVHTSYTTHNEWMEAVITDKVKASYRASTGVIIAYGTFEDLQDTLIMLKLIGK